MIATLAAILETAVEYGHIDRDVAKGKRRRLKAPRPQRVTLTRAEHIEALLEAAAAMDKSGRSESYRRPLLGILVFAAPRITEALTLRRRDIDLPGQRLVINGTKTDAAQRVVELAPILHDILSAYLAEQNLAPDDLLFGTRSVTDRYEGGRPRGASNIRLRVLERAVEKANAQLIKRDVEPIPQGVTPHGLRRTFVSILCARGVDLPAAMRQAGHTTPQMTLGIYATAWDSSEEERKKLARLWNGEPVEDTQKGRGMGSSPPKPVSQAGSLDARSKA